MQLKLSRVVKSVFSILKSPFTVTAQTPTQKSGAKSLTKRSPSFVRTASFGHSSQSCAGACMGYKYFALQGGGQCFCGKAFGSSPQHAKAPDGQCGRICVGEEGKTPPRLCGGGWRNAVYASPLGASETAGWRVGGSTLA